jgi:hypothetical protein
MNIRTPLTQVQRMDKYLIKTSTLELLGDLEEVPIQKEFVLGILGNSSANFWSSKTILETLMEPILSEQERAPTKILLPSDGITSVLLETWAGKNKVESKVYSADWKVLGRRARAIRDSQIIKESSHLLVFLGGRSDYYGSLAMRELKKGKVIYTVDAKTHELTQWEL